MVAPRGQKINIPKMDNKPGGANPGGEAKALPAAKNVEPKPNPEGKRATVVE